MDSDSDEQKPAPTTTRQDPATGRPVQWSQGRRRSTCSHISVNKRVVLTVNEHEKLTVGEFQDKVGFGWYQAQVFIMSFGALMVETGSISMVSACVNPMSREFQADSALGKAGFVGFLYLGIQLGTISVGGFLDRFGRRRPLLVGYAGMVIFGVAATFARCAKAMYALLFLLGIFAGMSVPCAIITLSEVVPSRLRGIASAALGIGFRVGMLWSALVLCIWMPELDSGPWRSLLVAAVAPAAVFLVFCFISPAARQDTPPFLAIVGQGRALVSTLNLMAETNRRPELRLVHSDDLQYKKEAHSVTIADVAGMAQSAPLERLPRLVRLHFLILTVLFFCKEFVAGGTMAYWPVTFAQLHNSGPTSQIETWTAGSHLGFPTHLVLQQMGVQQTSAAMELIITALVSFPGIAVAMWAMHKLPRRVSLAVGASLTSVGGLLLLSMYGHYPALGVVGVGIIRLFFPLWQMVTMLLASEIFPTQVRGVAYSAAYFTGRFGSEVAQLAVHSGQVVFPALTAALAVGAVVLVSVLPETKDTELTNFCQEPERPFADYGATTEAAGGPKKPERLV